MSEPSVIYATVRETIADEIDIECRFSDGQKFAAVRVEAGFDALAFKITRCLCGSDTNAVAFGRAMLRHILDDRAFFEREESEEVLPILQRFGYVEYRAFDPATDGESDEWEAGEMLWFWTTSMKADAGPKVPK